MLKSPQQKLNDILEQPMFELAMGMKGHFRLEVRRHGELVKTAEFDNLILDQGLAYLGLMSTQNIQDFCLHAKVGSGSSPPNPTQTQLDIQRASIARTTSGAFGASPNPPYIRTCTHAYAFAQGAVTTTITEVGVGWAAVDAALFCRTLITDNGVPTPITLTAIDQLTVYYSFSLVPNLTTKTGSMVLEGNTYTYTLYPTYVRRTDGDQYFSTPGTSYPLMGVPAYVYPYPSVGVAYAAGTPLSPTLITDQQISAGASTYQYVLSNAEASYTLVNPTTCKSKFVILPAAANFVGGIQAITIFQNWGYNNQFGFQVYFDTPVPKDITKKFTIVFTSSWSSV